MFHPAGLLITNEVNCIQRFCPQPQSQSFYHGVNMMSAVLLWPQPRPLFNTDVHTVGGLHSVAAVPCTSPFSVPSQNEGKRNTVYKFKHYVSESKRTNSFCLSETPIERKRRKLLRSSIDKKLDVYVTNG